MKPWKVTLIVVLLIAISVSITYLAFYGFMTHSKYRFYMKGEVTNEAIAGVSVDTDKLDFGKFGPGGRSTKKIVLTNNDSKGYFVQIRMYGNISDFVFVEDNNFVIAPFTNRTLNVTALPPADKKTGVYDGWLEVAYQNILFGGGG